jgi:hypothetical protein
MLPAFRACSAIEVKEKERQQKGLLSQPGPDTAERQHDLLLDRQGGNIQLPGDLLMI